MIKRLIIDNSVLIIQYAVNGLVPLLLVPHIIKQIGLEAYGELAIVLAWASYGVLVIQYSFHLTGPKRIAQLEDDIGTGMVLREIAATKFFLLAVVFLFLAAVFTLIYPKDSNYSTLVIVVLLPLGAAFNSAWFLQSLGQFPLICIVSVIACCGSLIVGFTLVDGGQDFDRIYAALALAISTAFFGVITYVAALFLSGTSVKNISIKPSLQLLGEGWPLFISQIIASIYMFSGPIFIGSAIGVEEAGSYSAIERIVNPLIGVCLLTYTAAYPRLAGLYHAQRGQYYRLLRFALLGYFAVSVSLVITLFLVRGWLLRYLFGETIPLDIEKMLYAGMALMLVSIFGVAYTGHLTISGQGRLVLPLTFKILVVTLMLGVPGVFFIGPWTWMASLALSQFVILHAAVNSQLFKRYHGENFD